MQEEALSVHDYSVHSEFFLSPQKGIREQDL